MNVKGTIGGLAGACALTLLNEGAKKLDKDAPKMDLLGMNAVARLTKGNNILTQAADKIFPVALAGNLVSNSLYFSMAESSNNKSTLIRGTLLGLAAGAGAVFLPKALGLKEQPTAGTLKTKALTIAWYLIGGIVAAAAINALEKDSRVMPHGS